MNELRNQNSFDIETNAEPRTYAGSSGIMANLTEKAKDVAGTVSDAADQFKHKVHDWTSTAADSLGEAKHNVQEWASTAAHNTGETAATFGRELTRLLRRYPVPALLIGFGLGVVLARVIRRL